MSERLTVADIIAWEARREVIAKAERDRLIKESLMDHDTDEEREKDADWQLASATAYLFLRLRSGLPLVNLFYVALKAKGAAADVPKAGLAEATSLIKQLYAGSQDDDEGDCLYCGAEGYCHDDCIIEKVRAFLGIELPEKAYGAGLDRAALVAALDKAGGEE